MINSFAYQDRHGSWCIRANFRDRTVKIKSDTLMDVFRGVALLYGIDENPDNATEAETKVRAET